MGTASREIHLVDRPEGEPSLSAFAMVDVQVPAPGAEQVLVRNDWMSVDPAMRGRMRDVPSYIAPFRLHEPMEATALGEVVASGSAALPVGSSVVHRLGWREYSLLESTDVERVDLTRASALDHLSVLGPIGLTAYTGLKRIAPVAPGDVVLVSGAAGAVGLVAGVVARKLGASRVIGSAGGPEKTLRLVEEFGYDAAIDYRAGSLRRQLSQAAPDGIDVYFDNVGGDQLRAAISALRPHGRVALCGQVSSYNATATVPGPDNLGLAISKRLSLRGFIVFDHQDLAEEYTELALGWLADGSLRSQQTVVEGIENAPQALLGLFRGDNTGKMLVRLARP